MIRRIEKTEIVNGLYLEMIKNVEEINVDDIYYTMQYVWIENNLYPYAIKNEEGKHIGYVFLEQTDTHVIYVKFIEICEQYKGEGFGTTVVQSIFEWFDINFLEGTILDDGHLCAYYFWLSLGAEIDCIMNEYDEPDFDGEVSFVLKKE